MDMAGFNELAVQYGIFAALFISLLVYVIRENAKREKAYQETIERLGHDLSSGVQKNQYIISESKCVIEGIEVKIGEVHGKVQEISHNVGIIREDISELKEKSRG
jgi:uncharacterized protein YoxC